MRDDGLNIGTFVKKQNLQRQLSDAINDYNEEMYREKSKNRRKKYENERDEFYGPKHPMKTKYRELNHEATKLFFKSREENLFYN